MSGAQGTSRAWTSRGPDIDLILRSRMDIAVVGSHWESIVRLFSNMGSPVSIALISTIGLTCLSGGGKLFSIGRTTKDSACEERWDWSLQGNDLLDECTILEPHERVSQTSVVTHTQLIKQKKEHESVIGIATSVPRPV